MENYKKSNIIIMNLNYQLQHGTKTSNYLTGHILYQKLKIVSIIKIKKNEIVSDNPPIRIHIYKIGNRVTFKIKTGYFLEMLTSETMNIFGSTKSKITKNENEEKVPHLKRGKGYSFRNY